MKKIVIVLAAMASFNAHAEWVTYQHRADADELYDSKLISREGPQVRLWTMTNFATPMATLEGKDYQSEKMLTTIDCAARKAGAEQVVRLAGRHGQGEVISLMDSPLRMVPIKAGSADEALLSRVCQ